MMGYAVAIENLDIFTDSIKRRNILQIFEAKYIPEPNSGCWLWTGATHYSGYGKMTINKKHVQASHVALALAGRAVPQGLFALHRCDNPPCVNPDHLFHGTQKDNIQDCRRKKRHSDPPRSGSIGSAWVRGARRRAICSNHLNGENRKFDKDGSVFCAECRKREAKERWEQKRESRGIIRKEDSLLAIKERNRKIVALYESGVPRRDVAKIFNVCVQTVWLVTRHRAIRF